MRIFIAVDLPAKIKAEVSAFQEASQQLTRASIRWTRQESLHLTLKFLGEIEESRLAEVENVVRSVSSRYRPIHLYLKGFGVFPNIRNPRIFWVGTGGETEYFARLAEDIDQGLSECGYPREEHSYKPHLTVGRFKSPFGASEIVAHAHRHPLPVLSFRVDEVLVMRSVLNPRAAVYTSLLNCPLIGTSQ